MLINELIPLTEKVVDSSWLSDVTYMNFVKKKDSGSRPIAEPETSRLQKPEPNRNSKYKKGDIKIIVKDGRSYTVKDVPYMVYRNWQLATSKGKFWHAYIKDKYRVV